MIHRLLSFYGLVILRFGGIEEEEAMFVLSFEERFDVDLGPVKSGEGILLQTNIVDIVENPHDSPSTLVRIAASRTSGLDLLARW